MSSRMEPTPFRVAASPTRSAISRRTSSSFLTGVNRTGVFAQAASDPGHGRDMAAELKKRFGAADANHDGLLSREEAKNGMPFVYRNFDAIDTAKTGQVSMAEIAAFFRAKGAQRKAGG